MPLAKGTFHFETLINGKKYFRFLEYHGCFDGQTSTLNHRDTILIGKLGQLLMIYNEWTIHSLHEMEVAYEEGDSYPEGQEGAFRHHLF